MSDNRILFDTNRIEDSARAVDRFRDEFTSNADRIRGERDRSAVSFTGVAGDAFRTMCDSWLGDADDFTAALTELANWLDSVNSDYTAARSASRSMFPG